MLPVGTLLRAGSYRIERQISSGGFGNTYVVRNISFDEVYAMKEFFMKGVNLRNGSDVTVSITDNKTTFESQRNKFKKEAKRLRKLNNPHIVKVHDLFDENGTVYYVMDLIDGHTLSDIVKKDGPMSEEMAMNIFWQILEALDVVHNQNPMMLHLDIKPSNIMVDKSGNAYLLDFGSSKQVDSDHNMTSSAFTMTPGYAPSELIDHNPNRIGPWTDLYELGATIYHLLTGQQPPTISEISEEGNDAFSFPKTISNKTREYILWLMSLSRTKRPKSVRDVYGLYAITQSGEEDNKGEDKDHDKTVIVPSNNMTSGGDETVLSNQDSNTSPNEGNESINSPKPTVFNNYKYWIPSIIGLCALILVIMVSANKTQKADIPCTWDFADSFRDGLACVGDENGKYGYIDKVGEIVVPCTWDNISYFSEGLAVVSDDKAREGYIDKMGEVVIPCTWKNASPFREGLACVEDDYGKHGFIDKTGKLVISCKWKSSFSFFQGLASVEDENGKFGFIDKTGELVIPCKWKSADWFCEGLARVEDDNGKYGYIDMTGNVVIPCKWVRSGDFNDGLAFVCDFDNYGREGFIDKKGNLVIPCSWKWVSSFSEGLAMVKDDNGKFGFIDKTGNLLIPCTWKGADSFSEGFACVVDDNEKCGYIDKTGDLVIPCTWEVAGYFKEGMAMVKDENEKWGFISKK